MRNKISVIRNRALFAKAPAKIFKMELTPFEITIFFYLTSLAEEVNPSVVSINQGTNISIPVIVNSMKKLEELNMIKKYHQGSIADVNKYEFIDWKQWKKGIRK